MSISLEIKGVEHKAWISFAAPIRIFKALGLNIDIKDPQSFEFDPQIVFDAVTDLESRKKVAAVILEEFEFAPDIAIEDEDLKLLAIARRVDPNFITNLLNEFNAANLAATDVTLPVETITALPQPVTNIAEGE